MSAAVSVQTLVSYWKKHQVNNVLDYGAGNLRNACFLKEQGFNVVIVETPEHLRKIKAKICRYHFPEVVSDAVSQFHMNMDLVIANFVLNIIENFEDRKKFVANVYHNLKGGGFFLAEVKEKRNWYQEKGLTEEELDLLVMRWNFHKAIVLRRRGLLGILYCKALSK